MLQFCLVVLSLRKQYYDSQKEFKKKISLNLIHVMVYDNNIINLRYLGSCVLHLIATIQKDWFDRFLVIICWCDLKWFKNCMAIISFNLFMLILLSRSLLVQCLISQVPFAICQKILFNGC